MSRFRSYIHDLDWDGIYSTGTLESWFRGFIVYLFLVALGAWIPVTSRHIQLHASPALFSLGVMLILVIIQTVIYRRDGTSFRLIAYMILCSPLVELTMTLMASQSKTTLGRIIYGMLFFLAALSHAWMYRTSWKQPYTVLSLGLLMPIAALVDLRAENIILVGTFTVGAMMMMLIVGTSAEIQFRNQQRAAAEQAAVAAQMLEQANSEAAGWERQFTLLAGLHHDVGNLLTRATLKSGLMLRKLQAEHTLVDSEEMTQGFVTINDALKTVSTLLTAAKKATPAQPTERIDLVPVLKSAADNIRTSPALSLSLELPAVAPVDAPGGEATLMRLFDNLLRNAVEGNGKLHARNIRLELVDTGAAFAVYISDDGPGFPEHLLSGRAKGYFTTKTQGTGLGLVTAEALTAACRGTLRRSNPPGGGARVDVVLPRAREPSASPPAEVA